MHDTLCGRGSRLEDRAAKDDTPNRADAKGFFTDTTLCIGCKACEVACKQWNQLPDDGFIFTGMSYDNTVALGASTWRHVAFIERPVALSTQDAGAFSWLFSSDVCKHCARAGCLESLPDRRHHPHRVRHASTCSRTSATAAAIAWWAARSA